MSPYPTSSATINTTLKEFGPAEATTCTAASAVTMQKITADKSRVCSTPCDFLDWGPPRPKTQMELFAYVIGKITLLSIKAPLKPRLKPIIMLFDDELLSVSYQIP